MANPNDILQIINVMLAAFPNFKPSELTPEVYMQTLGDIPTEELKAAVLHSMSESGRAFAPSIGEIRGAVSELRSYAANVPSSFQAWQEVLKQFSVAGSYRVPEFSHPLIDRAVRALGWRELCMSENQIADRARFIQCYEQLLSRAQKDDMLLPDVRGYIQANGALLEAPATSIKLLADRLRK